MNTENSIDTLTVTTPLTDGAVWFFACFADDVPDNGGACVKYMDEQIAIFNFVGCVCEHIMVI